MGADLEKCCEDERKAVLRHLYEFVERQTERGGSTRLLIAGAVESLREEIATGVHRRPR